MNDEEFKKSALYPTAIYLLLVKTIEVLANQGVIDVPRFIDDISHVDLHPDSEEALNTVYKEVRQGVVQALAKHVPDQQ